MTMARWRKASLISVTVILVVGAFAGAGWERFPSWSGAAGGHGGSGRLTDGPAGEADTGKPGGYRWASGDFMSYQLTWSSRVSPGASRGGKSYDMRAIYHFKVIDVSPTRREIVALTTMGDVEFTRDGMRVAEYDSLLSQIPCLVHFTASGKITRWEFPGYLDEEDQALPRGFRAIQAEVGKDARKSWTARETGDYGPVTTEYSRPGGPVIGKRRLRYEKPAIEGWPEDGRIEFRDSAYEFTLGPVWLDRYAGGETVAFLQGGREVVRSENRVQLQARPKAVRPGLFSRVEGLDYPAIKVLLNREVPPIVREAAGGSVTDLAGRSTLVAEYGLVPFAGVMKPLAEAVNESLDDGSDIRAIERLADWLKARPDMTGQVADEIIARQMDSEDICAALIHALSLSSANQESRLLLGRILRDRGMRTFNGVTLAQAAFAAGGLGGIPDPEITAALWELGRGEPRDERLETARTNAQLALGALAKDSPDLQEKIAARYLPLLRDKSPDRAADQELALLSLKNSRLGNGSLAEAATRIYQESGSVDLRLAALGYLSTDESNTGMVSAALHSGVVGVEAGAIGLLCARERLEPGVLDELLGILRDGKRPSEVRIAAAVGLDAHRPDEPSIEDSFSEILKKHATGPDAAVQSRLVETIRDLKETSGN